MTTAELLTLPLDFTLYYGEVDYVNEQPAVNIYLCQVASGIRGKEVRRHGGAVVDPASCYRSFKEATKAMDEAKTGILRLLAGV